MADLVILGQIGESARSIEVSPDQRHALVGAGRELVLWNLAESSQTRAEMHVSAARFLSNTCAVVVSGALDWSVETVALPSLTSGARHANLDRGNFAHLDVLDGRYLVASDECVNPNFDHHMGRVWVFEQGGASPKQPALTFDDCHLEGAAWISPDRVAVWFEDSANIEVHDLRAGRIKGDHRASEYGAHPEWVGRISSDEIIATYSNGVMCTWRVGEPSPRLELRVRVEGWCWPTPSVALSPDRGAIAIVRHRERLRVFDTNDGRCRFDAELDIAECAFSGAHELLVVLQDGALARVRCP